MGTPTPCDPWHEVAGGVTVRVRLTPRGGADRLDGVLLLSDGTSVVTARVRAAPENGLANIALLKLMAAAAGAPARAVNLKSGATGRIKLVQISGSPEHLIASLRKAVNRQVVN